MAGLLLYSASWGRTPERAWSVALRAVRAEAERVFAVTHAVVSRW
ncbi:hypothetical protein [Streptomyces canus]|nr:hypothetical protein [Streptomyces canus]